MTSATLIRVSLNISSSFWVYIPSGTYSGCCTELRIERRQKLTEDEDDQLLATLKDLNGTLDEYEPTVEFDNGLFNEIVESITVDSSKQLTFKLIGGIALTEQIPKKGR